MNYINHNNYKSNIANTKFEIVSHKERDKKN